MPSAAVVVQFLNGWGAAGRVFDGTITELGLYGGPAGPHGPFDGRDAGTGIQYLFQGEASLLELVGGEASACELLAGEASAEPE